MPKYLRSKSDPNYILPFNGDMAKCDNVEIVDSPDPQFDAEAKAAADAEAIAAAKAKATPKAKVETSAAEPENGPDLSDIDIDDV